MNWVFPKLGGEKHYNQMNEPNKILTDLVLEFLDIRHHNLHPFFLYLEIRVSDGFDFWCGEASE
jgi:hypothetical protein